MAPAGLRGADRFDISAKGPPGTTRAQATTMLQNLLAEGFQLTLHHETAQLSGYALVVARERGQAQGKQRPG